MAIRDIFKVSRKTFFNPSGWLDLETLRDQNRTIWEILKSLFTPEKPERSETFEEAIQRLNMTETDVMQAIRYYRYYAFGFFILGFLSLIYSFYLLVGHGSWTGLLLSLGVTALLGVQAFKYDFWAFQMASKKLGLTFKDWRNNLFKGDAA